MTDLIKQYLEACATAKVAPQAQLIVQLEQHFGLPVQEESYVTNSLDEECEIYRRMQNEPENKKRAEQILDYLALLKQQAAGLKADLDFGELERLGSKRIVYIKNAAAADLQKTLELQLGSVGGDLRGLDLRHYAAVLQSDLLKESYLNKRVRTLLVAQNAAKSLFQLFGASFSVSRGTLTSIDFEKQMQGLSQEMARFEERTVSCIQQAFTPEPTSSSFPRALAASGMFRRKAVQQGVENLAGPAISAFLSMRLPSQSGGVDQVLLELQATSSSAKTAFQVIQGLFQSFPQFAKAEQFAKDLQLQIAQRQQEVVNLAQQRIAQAMVSYAPQFCLFFDQVSKKAVGGMPAEVDGIYRIVLSVERAGLKFERSAASDQIKLVLQAAPACVLLGNLAEFYNMLFSAYPPYFVEILAPQIQKFEGELKKCSQASLFKFEAAAVEQLCKVAKYAENVAQSFQAGYLNKLIEFRAKWNQQVALLEQLSLTQKEQWKQRTAAMRHLLSATLSGLSDGQSGSTLMRYTSACVAKLIARKYSAHLRRFAGVATNVKLRMTARLRFERTRQQFLVALMQAYDEFISVLDDEFSIGDAFPLADLKCACIQSHCAAFNSFQALADQLYGLESLLLDNYGGIVDLNEQKSEALCAQYCTDAKKCELLYQYGMTLTQAPYDFLYEQFPNLTPINDSKHLFRYMGCEIDLSDCVQTLNAMPVMIQNIAVMAASHLTVQQVHVLLNEVQLFSQKTQQITTAMASSRQLAELKDYLEKARPRVLDELSQVHDEMRRMLALLQLQSQQNGNVASMAEMCSQQYLLLRNSVEGMEALISEKKKAIGTRLQDDAALLDKSCEQVLGAYTARLKENAAFFQQCVLTNISAEELPVVLRQQTDSQSAYSSQCKNIQTIDKELLKMQEQLEDADQEMRLLFNKPYFDSLGPAQRKTADSVLRLKSIAAPLLELLLGYSGVFKVLDELTASDWLSLRTRFDLFETMQQEIDTQRKRVEKLMETSTSDTSLGQHLLSFWRALQECNQFLAVLCECLAASVKMLKTPVLTRQHWLELLERCEMQQYVRNNAKSGAYMTSFPDSMTGAAFLSYLISLLGASGNRDRFQAFQKTCREVIVRAENEQSIRGAVDEVQFYLQSEARVQLTLTQLSDFSQQELSGVAFTSAGASAEIKFLPTAAQWKPILTALSEKKQILTSVGTSPYAAFLAPQIQDCSAAIEAITQFALIQAQVARQIGVLEPVIARRVLVNEQRRFYSAAKVVAAVFSDQEENPLVLGLLRQTVGDEIQLQALSLRDELAGYKAVVQQMEAASVLLQQVQTALRVYLEEKRLIFPRFYFLADSDVLEILASATQMPELINKHVKKMFSAIERVKFDENSKITAFTSPEGETVALRSAVAVEGNPEVWLDVLDRQIKVALKLELLECLKISAKVQKPEQICESYAQIKGTSAGKLAKLFLSAQDSITAMKEDLDINKYSGEVLTIAFAVMYTALVDHALAAQNAEQQLTQILQRMQQYLKAFTSQLYDAKISQASYGSAEYVIQLRLKQLATDTTHFITVTQQMISEATRRDWIWNRELKYRIFVQTGDLYLVSLDTFLPYTFEYQGLPARLIHTPLTDRCYATLTSALGCAISSNPQGPAGTGKTESVKAYCAKLARPCIVFNCDSAIDREDLSRILVGIILSGSVGCFDEINRLSPSVLSAVSTDIEDVQKAISRRSMNQGLDTQFTLSGISVPLSKISPFSAVFVTMNPASREYRGRSELPFSLLKLLRPCFMGRADTSIIMETILATTGFVHARVWALKVDLAYSLASRRIPKQVHLDWGLRSLQAVLRQAALARAALKDVSEKDLMPKERAVVIKALSDATFSRVQGVSRSIFAEILTDVFGKIDAATNKFGATNELEEKLADKIDANERVGCLAMQLFRALTAKTGVALLGNSASGKTQVREVLKKAVLDASNGFIEMREFLISPKAMSRSELLGYVDQQSKEWNEGALTRAARLSVSYLSGTSKPFIWPLIVFDGEIDPLWIESLNSSLDDNRLLSLSSGERIRFPMSLNPLESYYGNAKLMNTQGGTNMRMDYKIPTPVSFLFETDSLQHASPATVSRLAVILVADPALEEQIGMVSSMDPKLCAALQCLDVNEKNLPLLATQMTMASRGEKARGGAYQLGAIRVLYNWFEQLDAKNYQRIAEKFELKLNESAIVSPAICPKQSMPAQQAWAISVIQSYLSGESPVILAGEAQTGKHYCLTRAIDPEIMELASVSCTSLTTRDDIMQQLFQACQEYQRGDGQKILRPKSSGKRVILFIRNADIVSADEYGHSQIFSLIWSMVAHSKVYLRGGADCLLQSITIVISVQRYDLVPDRLKRLMGVVRFHPFSEQDYQYIIPGFFSQYSRLLAQNKLSAWLQQEVERAEISFSRASQLQLPFNIAFPNYLKLVERIPVSQLLSVARLNLETQRLFCVLQYIFIAPIPSSDGKKIAMQDFSVFNVQAGQYPTLFTRTVGKSQARLLQQGVQTLHEQTLSFVGEQERIQQCESICKEIGEFYPCLRNFQAAMAHLPAEARAALLFNLSAFELAVYLTHGAIVYSLPDNLSFESVVLGLAISDFEIRFMGADKLSSQVIKALLEAVAGGRTRLAIVLDQTTLGADDQWTQFVSALAAQDSQYIRGRLSQADLRGISSIYQEKAQISEDVSEAQLQAQLLELALRAIVPVIFISPEHKCADSLLISAPPLRRQYQTVFYDLISSNKEPPPVVCAQFAALNSQLEPMVIVGFSTLLNKYYSQYELPDRFIQPNEYLKCLLIQQFFSQRWQLQITRRRTQLQAGLRQLQSAQTEVDKLAKEAALRKVAVEQAQRDANQALEEITAKIQIVQDSKQKSSAMQLELQQNEHIAKQQYDEANKELSTVQPILEQASLAVSQIPNEALTEVKSFKNPPPAVAVVLEAVLSFMGQSDVSWGGMRSFLSQNGILRQIANLDIKNVPGPCLKKVLSITAQNPDCFVQEKIYKVSRAAAPLALWVTASLQYAAVYVKVEPLMQKAQQADAALTALRKQLSNTEEAITRLETETQVLRANFDQKTKDLLRFQKELGEIEVKKTRGDTMLGSLKEERARWAVNEAEAEKQLGGIAKASILAAALYVCAGKRTDDIREHFAGASGRRFISSLLLAGNAQFRDSARAAGLRMSDQALENAFCVNLLRQRPGVVAFVISNVTEATGALKWLVSETGAQVVSATSENLGNLLAIAARFGQTIIVTDCDSGQAPAAAVPYLRYGASCYRKSESASDQTREKAENAEAEADFSLLAPQCTLLAPATSARPGEMHCQFRMFLVSSVSLQLPADLKNRTIELSFAPTERSRVDFYVDQIMQQWSPDTLAQIQRLEETEAGLRGALEKVETALLDALEQSAKAPNILEDENLMKVLAEATAQSKKIKETQAKSAQLKQELEGKQKKAAAIAEVVGKSVFALEAINNLNELYVVDDSSIVPLLRQVLFANMNRDFDDKISKKAVHEYLFLLYARVANMVFSQDSVGAYALLLQYCSDMFTSDVFDYITGKFDRPATMAVPKWASSDGKQFLLLVGALGAEQAAAHFDDPSWEAFSQQVKDWKDLDLRQFPSVAQNLGMLQKALIVSFLRPDMLSQCLQTVCDQFFLLEKQAIEDPLQQAIRLVSGILQPIIVYTASGQDPTSGLTAKIVAISPGKEAEADAVFMGYLEQAGKNIESGAQTLIVVKGAHLCQSWLTVLPSKLQECAKSFSAKYDESFPSSIRLVLLLEPKLGFPRNLSRISWRIHLHAKSTAKSTFISLVNAWAKPPEGAFQGLYHALMYTLTGLHSIIDARRQYAPRGIASDPGWNSQDLVILSEMLAREMRGMQGPGDAKALLDTVRGLVLDVVYGVSTRDPCDLQLLNVLFTAALPEQFCQFAVKPPSGPQRTLQQVEECFSSDQQLKRRISELPFLKYVLPPLSIAYQSADTRKALQEFVASAFPQAAGADVLALPANALLAKGERDSLVVKSILQRAGGAQMDAGDQRGLYAQSQSICDYFDQIGPEIARPLPKPLQNAIAEELFQQARTIQKLAETIKQDLDLTRYALNNPLLASPRAKQIATYLSKNIAPEHWTKDFQAPPTSVAPLDLPDLVLLRQGSPTEFLQLLPRSLKACLASMSGNLEISLVPRPPALLEAVRRQLAVEKRVELDQVEVCASLGGSGTLSIQAGHVQLQGASLEQGGRLNLQQNNCLLPAIFIHAGKSKGGIPLYVDKSREIRMPVVDALDAGEDLQKVVLGGVYMHLLGR